MPGITAPASSSSWIRITTDPTGDTWSLSEDVGAVFLYYGKKAALRKPWLKGIKEDRDGEYPFWGNNTGYFDIYIGETGR